MLRILDHPVAKNRFSSNENPKLRRRGALPQIPTVGLLQYSLICHKLKDILIPGSTSAVYVGSGPTAHMRQEHLEMASITGKNNINLAGRTNPEWRMVSSSC